MIYFKVFLLFNKFAIETCFHFQNPLQETRFTAVLFIVLKSCDFEAAAMNLAACVWSEAVLASFSIISVIRMKKYMKYLYSSECKLSFGGS